MNVSKKKTRAPDEMSSARQFFTAHLRLRQLQDAPAPPDETVEWFVANREPLSAAQRKTFVGWLQRSPAHVAAYFRIAKLAGDIGKAAAADWDSSLAELVKRARLSRDDDDFTAGASTLAEAHPEQPPVPAARGHRFEWVAAVVAQVVCGVWIWSTFWVNPPNSPVEPVRIATQHGQQITHRLSDGSVLHLNTDTSVSVSYSAESRSLSVERGQAEFEVARDAARPFRVIAGSAEVVAVGTIFDVYRQPGETLVTVVEGMVNVCEITRLGGAVDDQAAAKAPIQVRAGEQLRIVPGGTSGPAPVDTRAATAWLRRQLVFEGEPLGVVAK